MKKYKRSSPQVCVWGLEDVPILFWSGKAIANKFRTTVDPEVLSTGFLGFGGEMIVLTNAYKCDPLLDNIYENEKVLANAPNPLFLRCNFITLNHSGSGVCC